MDGSVSRRTERFSALLLTLGLQATFLALLLYSFQHFAPPRAQMRETLLSLPRLIAQRPAPTTIDARGRLRPAPPVFMPAPQFTPPNPAPGAAATPDIQSLGHALNGCAPETYASLSPEQRTRCSRPGDGLAVKQAPNLMGERSHVKDEAHWQEELAREQSPTILPCMGGADLLCVLKVIATGDFSQVTDPRAWPHYEVRQIPPEDFRKIEQAYDAWHKAHRQNAPP